MVPSNLLLTFSIFFIFISLPFKAEAQVTQIWVARYNGTANTTDIATDIAIDVLGNVYVTGISKGAGTDDDFVTIKYNQNGIEQWVQRYNGPGNKADKAYSIAVDNLGNVYVTGTSLGGTTKDDLTTIKYNTTGSEEWIRRFNGTANGFDGGYSNTVDDLGNVYVTGYTTGNNAFDCITIKYSSDGTQQWVQTYNGPSNSSDIGTSIVVDKLGNVYVVGYSQGQSTGDDYITIKYNSEGTQLWVQRYNGTGNYVDQATSVAVDDSGNVYVTGYSWGGSSSLHNYATIKYNSSGIQQWVQIYNGTRSDWDVATSLGLDSYGNVYVTGYSSGEMYDFATIKYNSSGVQQWVQRYNGPGNNADQAYALAIDNLANVYVTGSSISATGSTDYTTIKYDASGIQQWIQKYASIGSCQSSHASSICVDDLGNVYITGQSCQTGAISEFDYVTVKYSQSSSLVESKDILNTFVLYQNFPNPFNSVSNIKFEIVNTSYVILKIFDLFGREITTLINEKLDAGTYTVTVEANNYLSGIYFYHMIADNFSETRKMVLIK